MSDSVIHRTWPGGEPPPVLYTDTVLHGSTVLLANYYGIALHVCYRKVQLKVGWQYEAKYVPRYITNAQEFLPLL